MQGDSLPILRFWIAIGLRLALGAAGMVLGAYGWFNVVLSGVTLATVYPYLQATGDEPPLGAYFQIFGVNLGLGLLGIFMLIFAVRGVIARIEAGLPSEDEGVGQSLAGRLGSALIYGLGFCFGAFSLAVSIVPGMQMGLLVATGVTVQAGVTGFDPTDKPEEWIAHYRYTTKAGQVHEGTIPSSGGDEFSRAHMKTLQVTYEPDHPERHQVTQYYGHADFMFFVLTRVLLVAVGLWGLMKNLSPMPPSTPREAAREIVPPTSRFAVETRPQDPPPRAVPPTRSDTRRAFGRRGA